MDKSSFLYILQLLFHNFIDVLVLLLMIPQDEGSKHILQVGRRAVTSNACENLTTHSPSHRQIDSHSRLVVSTERCRE